MPMGCQSTDVHKAAEAGLGREVLPEGGIEKISPYELQLKS